MRYLHVKLRDGYRHKGIWVVLSYLNSLAVLCLFIGDVINNPGAWWILLLYICAVPYLLLWPGLPGHLDWPGGLAPGFHALFAHLQVIALAGLLSEPMTGPPLWDFLLIVLIGGCLCLAFWYAGLGTGYLGAYWKVTTGRVRAYLASLEWKHPMELLLRRAMAEGRDLSPEERLAWEVYLANRMLEQGEYAPPAGASRMHRIRIQAAAERIRSETEAAASALGRMRVARLERVMSQQPPHTQEG